MSVIPTHPRLVELERLGDEIAELSAHLDAASARLLELIREFDARDGWNDGACRSCAHWLAWRTGTDLNAARERVRVARALGSLPRISAALARGEISYAKARALTRAATPETEEQLLAFARAGTAHHVERLVRAWRRVDLKAETDEAARQHRSRTLHVYQDDDGTVVIRGRLTAEVGALVVQALAAARDTLHQRARLRDPIGDPPSMEHQQADALALVAETALHHGIEPGAPGEHYQVVVHVDAAALADPTRPGQSVLEGARVTAVTSQRLACDASRVVMRYDDDGRIVEIGARTRTIPPAIRRAMQARDHSCRFPSCGIPFGQGHHIRHWAQGGPTTLSNLVLLCRWHHRAVHEDGYQVERAGDGELVFRRPDGRELCEAPATFPITGDPAERFRLHADGDGPCGHTKTASGSWSGERFDVGYAIDVMHPRATDEKNSGPVA